MTQSDEVRKRFQITGRVQGVGFRWWTSRQARELGLRGTVRNQPDGSVEVRAAGPTDALERMQSRLHDGPNSARVERVEEKTKDDGDLPDGFEIVR